jgi:hypothetical protein
MLEFNGALRTWALEREPQANDAIPAEALPDHRLAYLEYEGPVSGNRGIVTRVDQGEYQLIEDSPDRLTLVLQGVHVRGRGELTHQACASEPHQRWVFSLYRI